MIQKIWELKQQYGHVSNIYVDSANPEVGSSLIAIDKSFDKLLTALRTTVANEQA